MNADFQAKVSRIIDRVWHGDHHVRSLRWEDTQSDREWARVALYGREMATWDRDDLTRLVFACHDECVRASVKANGPNGLRVELRQREPGPSNAPIMLSHPTLDETVERWRRNR